MMAQGSRKSPSWCKWWMDDWAGSSLRKRLKTAAKRGIYREIWDICMSSPDPGAAVDSAGEPYSHSDLAAEIGCRLDHFEQVLRTCLAHGRITIGARDELRLCMSSTQKSLPDHWKYKRLRGSPSDWGQRNDAPRQKQRQKKKEENPLTPLAEDPPIGIGEGDTSPPWGDRQGRIPEKPDNAYQLAIQHIEDRIQDNRAEGHAIVPIGADKALLEFYTKHDLEAVQSITGVQVRRAWQKYQQDLQSDVKTLPWGFWRIREIWIADLARADARNQQAKVDVPVVKTLVESMMAEEEKSREWWAGLTGAQKQECFARYKAKNTTHDATNGAVRAWAWQHRTPAPAGRET